MTSRRPRVPAASTHRPTPSEPTSSTQDEGLLRHGAALTLSEPASTDGLLRRDEPSPRQEPASTTAEEDETVNGTSKVSKKRERPKRAPKPVLPVVQDQPTSAPPQRAASRSRNRSEQGGSQQTTSAPRRQRMVEFEVDAIGEFSTKQVLASRVKIGPGTVVRFDYKGPFESYVLCWIDETGRRHHAYPHSGTEWSHQESTNAGHAFAIFRKRDGKLLASYRIIAALTEGQIHVVSLPELRAKAETILVEARVIAELPHAAEFPSQEDWTVRYSFTVPPLPKSDKPDFFETNTIYVWGDLSFDEFSLEDERRPVHTYRMNQIVPQVMCGECLCGSAPGTYVPYWQTFHRWVAQAQHYYQDSRGEALGSRAVCGEMFEVEPGEKMQTTISYEQEYNQVRIRIASLDRPDKFSEVVTQNPFPNDPSIFPGGWDEFFRRKERKSTRTFRAYPCFNIEYKAQDANLDVLRNICPFKIHQAEFPGSTAHTPEVMERTWRVRGMNFGPEDNGGAPKVVFCT